VAIRSPIAECLIVDIYLYYEQYICMRTTLNLPDNLVKEAKRAAIDEGTTLTQLIVEGLASRIRAVKVHGPLPISRATGGLRDGVSWDDLAAAEGDAEAYR